MFTLPKLPYDFEALEPHIDAKTMEIHHDKHHAGYVNSLNKAIEGVSGVETEDVEKLLRDIDSVPEEKRQAVINFAGGHANHSLFWEIMIPAKDYKDPSDSLSNEIDKYFGSVDKFKGEFTDKALSLFGSGWVFLIADKGKKLSIKRHSFQNSPLTYGATPLIGIDVWEHEYYLKYQNKRAEYIENWWEVVNWEKVEENLRIATDR